MILLLMKLLSLFRNILMLLQKFHRIWTDDLLFVFPNRFGRQGLEGEGNRFWVFFAGFIDRHAFTQSVTHRLQPLNCINLNIHIHGIRTSTIIIIICVFRLLLFVFFGFIFFFSHHFVLIMMIMRMLLLSISIT